MRLALVTLCLMAGCYPLPSLHGAFRCDQDPRCPDEESCNSGFCGDRGVGDDDGGDDAPGFVHFDGDESFTRGCNSGPDCPGDAQPAATITLTSFLLQDHEVTQGEYAACVHSERCGMPPVGLYDPDHEADLPVRGITKQDAEDYCGSIGARLPTEAEWERAAREDNGRYPWGDAVPSCALANFAGCGNAPQAARTTGATPNGVRDLAGNVREWISDDYDPSFYATSSQRNNPQSTDGDGTSVVRGGSFASAPEMLLVWARDHLEPASAAADLGVRCAMATD